MASFIFIGHTSGRPFGQRHTHGHGSDSQRHGCVAQIADAEMGHYQPAYECAGSYAEVEDARIGGHRDGAGLRAFFISRSWLARLKHVSDIDPTKHSIIYTGNTDTHT